ncbi:MAG: hypothetical protein ACRD40_08830 [Candidatus Acidiferrales bacterium]
MNLRTFRVFAYLLEHQTSSAESRQRAQTAKYLRDQIRIDKIFAGGVIRQEFSGKGRLSGAIRPGNDVDTGSHEDDWCWWRESNSTPLQQAPCLLGVATTSPEQV